MICGPGQAGQHLTIAAFYGMIHPLAVAPWGFAFLGRGEARAQLFAPFRYFPAGVTLAGKGVDP